MPRPEAIPMHSAARRTTSDNIVRGQPPPPQPRPPLTRGSSKEVSLPAGWGKEPPSLRKASTIGPSGGSARGKDRRRSSEKDRSLHLKRAKEREERKEKLREQIRKEKITLLVFACISLAFLLLWIIAVSIDYWWVLFIHISQVFLDLNT
jgi:hypothetical protein